MQNRVRQTAGCLIASACFVLIAWPPPVSGYNTPPAVLQEVVGAAGRMGSFLLRSSPGAVAVPRGVCPGSLTEPGSPIWVATPSCHWNEIYQQTLSDRQDDLIWMGNGLLSPQQQQQGTVVVPHFAVLSVGSDPVTSPQSPPTYVYGGKQVDAVQTLLQQYDCRTECTNSFAEISTRAALKVLWPSCMWLLCHQTQPPRTVKQVHEECQPLLEQLVQELLPSLANIIGDETPELREILDYFKSYSLSMPQAIPSLDLARAELVDRNGVWIDKEQTLHCDLLEKIIGEEALQSLLTSEKAALDNNDVLLSSTRKVFLPELKLWCYGTTTSRQTPIQEKRESIVVIGSGILGCSVALNLARQGCADQITVLDHNPTLVGTTTPASWAWLNANQKRPPHYQWLNQAGMRGWRLDPLLQSLPIWNGALVCVKEPLVLPGGYTIRGPLSKEEWLELEPEADFSNGHVYYFAEEGCVDPCQAVQVIRDEAESLGVQFVVNQNVTSLLRDEHGRVTGVLKENIVNHQETEIASDVVVVAAGTGTTRLTGLPLVHSPGTISFAKPLTTTKRLNRILVDAVRESHVLQRRDGTIAAGGGRLQVGGGLTTNFEDSPRSDLLQGAHELAPGFMRQSEYVKSEEAVRPMPQDGLPVVGCCEPGLYSVVTHSGITLAPILSALVTAELCENLDLEILRPYRPARFLKGRIP